MKPVFSQFGQLLGWLSGNVIFGADGKNVAVVRNEIIYSDRDEYMGRLAYVREKLIWQEVSSRDRDQHLN